MSFRLVPKSKSVTLNDLERHNGRYFALFQAFSEFDSFRRALRIEVVEDIPKLSTTEM